MAVLRSMLPRPKSGPLSARAAATGSYQPFSRRAKPSNCRDRESRWGSNSRRILPDGIGRRATIHIRVVGRLDRRPNVGIHPVEGEKRPPLGLALWRKRREVIRRRRLTLVFVV